MMRHDYKPRLLVVLGSFFIVLSVVVIRLGYVQIYQAAFFAERAQQQHGAGITVNPPRALILDRHGSPLVVNEEVMSAFVLPHTFVNKAATKSFLQRYYPQVFAKMIKQPERYFWWLERACSKEKVAWLTRGGGVDIQFIAEPQRFYSFKSCGPLVGMTNIDNQGIAGLELAFDAQLKGTASTYILQKDARSKQFYFQRNVAATGQDGQNLQLTIDAPLQEHCFQALESTVKKFNARRGSVLVLNPFSGEILAMANYAPGDQVLGSEVDMTKNIAVTECFEPGSVMKTFAALAGLEEGVVGFDEEMDGEGKATYLQGLRVENWKSCGVVPFHDGVKRSSNVILAKVGLRLGPKLYGHLVRMGFGKKTELGFPGERSGFVNLPKNWSRFSVMVMTFGYELTATLLQLGRAFSIIANGGYWVEPHLIQRNETIKQGQPLYSKQSLEQILSILEKVGERYQVKGFKLKGKTGTARMVIDGQYSKQKHIYTFAGIIEKDDYRRVLVAFVQEPEKDNIWAADIAAPLAREVAEKMAVYEFCRGKL